MGSRAVVLVCRDEDVGRRRFGDATLGVMHTRTGRSFFDEALTARFLERLGVAVTAAGWWEKLGTDWVLLDAELMPWSAKAGDLLRDQYASVAAAARAALSAALSALDTTAERGVDVASLRDSVARRAGNAEAFAAAYRRYVWPVDGLEGLSLAPFQLLASEGATYAERPHAWHLEMIDGLVAFDPALLRTTRRLGVDTTDDASRAEAVAWWEDLIEAGGEGIVVKPAANLVRVARERVAQPGVKVRGREYLRLIYGPDYTEPEHLARLRDRRLDRKRSLAAREYALGLEALTRVAAGEPLWRIHEAVFAVLALESEPVDPRL